MAVSAPELAISGKDAALSSTDPKLTWEDLIVDNITPAEQDAWLPQWNWLVSGRVAPIFLSRFGNWFLRRSDGSTDLLDINEGNVRPVAQTPEEFVASVNTRKWQEEYLYSALLLQYRRQGIIASNRDAIGFAPHPALVSSIEACKIMVMTMNVWQSICSQTLQQLYEVK